MGKPALVKPIKSGMEEQEQKGVIVPNKAPSTFAESPVYRPSILRVLSGEK